MAAATTVVARSPRDESVQLADVSRAKRDAKGRQDSNLTTTERQRELDPCAAHVICHVLLATPRTPRGASIREGSSGHTDDIDE